MNRSAALNAVGVLMRWPHPESWIDLQGGASETMLRSRARRIQSQRLTRTTRSAPWTVAGTQSYASNCSEWIHGDTPNLGLTTIPIARRHGVDQNGTPTYEPRTMSLLLLFL